MDYHLVNSRIVFDADEIIEMLEEYIDEYILMEHYFEEQLIDAQIIFFEDVEIEYGPGEDGKYFKREYLKEDTGDKEFSAFLRNNFAHSIFINGSMAEIEIEGGRMVGFIGSRGELILRTGDDSYVFSALYNLKIRPESVSILLNGVIDTLKNVHGEITGKKIESETFAIISGVCLMAISKINELPLNNYELNLSHDEMLLLGLALNLALEYADQEMKKTIKVVMEQIKSYFPEIEHISPESFAPPPNMGQILDFKRPEKPIK